MSAPTDSQQSKPWLFQPGQSGNPAGRKLGSRNKLGEDFISALHDDFAQHGASVIKKVRTKRPHEYLKVVASVLPKQLEIKDDAFDGIARDQLAALIVAARAALGVAESQRSEVAGTGSQEPPAILPPVH